MARVWPASGQSSKAKHRDCMSGCGGNRMAKKRPRREPRRGKRPARPPSAS
jgi:hypothetical protein